MGTGEIGLAVPALRRTEAAIRAKATAFRQAGAISKDLRFKRRPIRGAKKKRCRLWTKKDKDQLIAMLSPDVTIDRALTVTKRSYTAICQRLTTLRKSGEISQDAKFKRRLQISNAKKRRE